LRHDYPGSINHTLLTLAALRKRELSVAGIIFNGEENRESERIILEQTGAKHMGRIEQEKEINPEIILKYATKFKDA